MQNMSFSQSKMNQNLMFWMRKFFSKSDMSQSFKFKIQRIVFFSIHNLRRCKTFKSKSVEFQYFYFKIWHVVNFFIQNLLFKSSFQILAELLSKCYQCQRTTCWIMTMACSKKIFYECVACVCLTFGTIFLVIAFFLALGFLVGVMTISLALPIDFYKSQLISENG